MAPGRSLAPHLDHERARQELAHCCQLLWHRKLVTGTSGNLSLRLSEDRFLITPTGAMFDRIDARDLTIINAAGETLEASSARPSSETPLHLATYAECPRAHAIIHAHPTYCVAWAGAGRLFPMDTVAATESLGAVAWVPYFDSGSNELALAVGAALGGAADVALMERHGITAVGATLRDALAKVDLAEECAKVAFLSATLKKAL